ncbi:MAG: hypothetical protein M1828_006618 [Chrysothrix sp. TS-e1954]|nr:MAG: hypothetical protein M1828_006618 [Chrysothrix sp. TS-e1954]
MLRRDETARLDPKRRQHIDHKKKQFAQSTYKQSDYKQRLNFYSVPPTADITLEEFEEWAIHRLKVLAELEACSFRNRTPDETLDYMRPILEKHLPLSQNSARSPAQQEERKKDHYSHFILRLAFSATEDLRHRFARLETQLFRLRFQNNDSRDRQDFVETQNFEWEKVSDAERRELSDELLAANPSMRRAAADDPTSFWFKVDFEKVPELVERRQVLLKRGKAYVPSTEQTSMVLSEFTRRLDDALEVTARALPRLDEDDRLSPILTHLSQNFTAPGSSFDSTDEALPGGAAITANSVDALSQHFPLCMRNLHMKLRQDSHLKHYGRLQYTLFLKGIGLSLDECLVFWRRSFNRITDETFNKEYRYNVRHAYGDVGGDSNRRGRGYTPYSCQKLLTEALPGPGQVCGCPYRTYGAENLISLLQNVGVKDGEVLKGVREDVGRQRYHIACNRVFEWSHKGEIKKAKDEEGWSGGDLDTIVHPNMYFKRSYLLKSLDKGAGPRRDIVMENA